MPHGSYHESDECSAEKRPCSATVKKTQGQSADGRCVGLSSFLPPLPPSRSLRVHFIVMLARLSAIFVATLLASSAWALGINCKGSSKCGDQPKDTLQRIYDLIGTPTCCFSTDFAETLRAETQIDPNFFFPDGRQIACASSVCAYLQNSQGTSGQVIKDILDDLKNHSCQICGSVPTLYRNGTNDVNKGELTLNFVDQACGDATAPCLGMLPQYQ